MISCQLRKMMLRRTAVLGVSKLKTRPFPSSLQLFASRLFSTELEENGINSKSVTEPDLFKLLKRVACRLFAPRKLKEDGIDRKINYNARLVRRF